MLKALTERRSCRSFKPDPIPEAILNAILEAGTYAATGMGRQSPVMIAVTDRETRDRLSRSGLAKDNERWPLLGNWISDYDGDGNLKPLDEIRPVYSTPAESAYNAEITLGSAGTEGFTVLFSAPVNTHDFAIAVNTVAGYTYAWNEAGTEVTVTYDAPVEKGTAVTAFVFRSVDLEGNMIGGPVTLVAEAQ